MNYKALLLTLLIPALSFAAKPAAASDPAYPAAAASAEKDVKSASAKPISKYALPENQAVIRQVFDEICKADTAAIEALRSKVWAELNIADADKDGLNEIKARFAKEANTLADAWIQILQHRSPLAEHKRLSELLKTQSPGNQYMEKEFNAMEEMLHRTIYDPVLGTNEAVKEVFSFFDYEKSPHILLKDSSEVLWGKSCCLQTSLKNLSKTKGNLVMLALEMKFQDHRMRQEMTYIASNVKDIVSSWQKIKPFSTQINKLTELRALRCAAATPYIKDVLAITIDPEQRAVIEKVQRQMDRAIRAQRKQERENAEYRKCLCALAKVRHAIRNPREGITSRQVLEHCRQTLPSELRADIREMCIYELDAIEKEIEQLEHQ